jgi:acyl-CoA synthetase (AMP-forming)/AMP-acid ligase II
VPTELNIGRIALTIADQIPDRPAVLQGDRAVTYRDLADRSSRLARYLHERGLGHFADRSGLGGHETGQHLMAQFLYNCPEYVEGLIGSYLGRVAPFNVNYRYQVAELTYLLKDAAPAAIQYHACFAPTLAQVLPHLSGVEVLLQVADGSGEPLLPGAVDYESALASAIPDLHGVDPSPDDLYIIYTGGTTGMPKGVLWRQADVAVSTLGLRNRRQDREWASVDECRTAVCAHPMRVLPCAPMMHGAAQWAALQAVCEGNVVVFPENAHTFAAKDIWNAVQRHHVSVLTIVGDAFGWPLVEELERTEHDVSSVKVIVSGGAALQAACKNRLLAQIPGLRIIENIGSSESGILGSRLSAARESSADATFVPDESMVVVAEDFSRLLDAGHDGAGWLAREGRIPLGYLGDAEKTNRTFPVVEGQRLTVPGDRARLLETGEVQLLGRDSLTINTGGEKVFVEEVEAVLKDHPAVVDALVCGRPSERWGAEVAAVVVAPGIRELELIEFCRDRLARYKVPKAIRLVERIARTETGKPDYKWAASQVAHQPPVSGQHVHSPARSGDVKEGIMIHE